MKTLNRKGLCALAIIILCYASARCDVSPYSTSEVIVPGVWNSNFVCAESYAKSHHAPLLVYFGSQACSYSQSMSKVLQRDEVKEWLKQHVPVLVYKQPTGTQVSKIVKASSAESSGDPDSWYAYKWVRKNPPADTKLPWMRLVWEKSDGTTVMSTFRGSNGGMPVKEPAGGLPDRLAQQFISSMELLMGDYVPESETPAYQDGLFAVTSSSVYQAALLTSYIDLSVSRTGSEKTNQTMTVAFPSGLVKSQTVDWAKDVSNLLVRVELPQDEFQLNKTVKVALLDGGGVEQSTTSITYVENLLNYATTANPMWIGEAAATNVVKKLSNDDQGEYNLSETNEVGSVDAKDIKRYATDSEVVVVNPQDWIRGMLSEFKGLIEESEATAFSNGLARIVEQMEFAGDKSIDYESFVRPFAIKAKLTPVITNWTEDAVTHGYLTNKWDYTHEGAVTTNAYETIANGWLNPVYLKDATNYIDVVGKKLSDKDIAITESSWRHALYASNKTEAVETSFWSDVALSTNDVPILGLDSTTNGYWHTVRDVHGTNTVFSDKMLSGQSFNVITNTFVTDAEKKIRETTGEVPYVVEPHEYQHSVTTNVISHTFVTNGWTKSVLEKWDGARNKILSASTNWIADVTESCESDFTVSRKFCLTNWVATLEVKRETRYMVSEFEMLEGGEWTMDLDAATNHVAWLNGPAEIGKPDVGDKKAVTFVYFSGALWSGNSEALSSALLDRDEFLEWAAANNVALVQMDLPAEDADVSLVTTGISSNGSAVVSGLSYLSRKCAIADAATIAERNAAFAEKWAREGEERIAVPTVVALNANGEVAARLVFDNKCPSKYDDKYLLRFDEMVAAARKGHDERDAYTDTSKLSVSAHGSKVGTISTVRGVQIFKLNEVKDGTQQVIEVTGEPKTNALLRVSLLEETESGLEECASATDELKETDGVKITADVSSEGSYWVRVETGDNSGLFDYVYDQLSSATSFKIVCGVVMKPELTRNTCEVSDGRVNFQFEAENQYWLEGIDEASESCIMALEPISENVYRARSSGLFTLDATNTTAKIVYRQWQPGGISFASEKVLAFAFKGTGSVEVVRADGVTGDARVMVRIAEGEESSETYTWRNTELSWDDCAEDKLAQLVGFSLATNSFQGSKSFHLSLATVEGSAAVPHGITNCTVTIYAEDKPTFEEESVDLTLYQKFAGTQILSVLNIHDDSEVKVTTTGSKPAGVNVTYDEDLKAICISGTPTKIAESTVICTVTETRSDDSVKTGSIALNFDVVSPTAKNAYALAKWNGNINLFGTGRDSEGNEVRRLAGTISVSATTANKVTAKYSGTESSSVVSFSGTWSELDEKTGEMSVTATVKNKGMLKLSVATNGVLTVTLTDSGNAFESDDGVLEGEGCVAETGVFEDYAGTYTVALNVAGFDNDAAPLGSGYLTLTMTSATAIKNGTVTYTGLSTDGTKLSGTAGLMLSDDGRTATLPIFKRLTSDVAGIVLTIKANAEELYDQTNNVDVVVSATGVGSYIWHRAKGYEWNSEIDAHGGYYDPTETLTDSCNQFLKGETAFYLAADGADFGESLSGYGELTKTPSANAVVNAKGTGFTLKDVVNKLTLKYAAKTGVVNGTGKVDFYNKAGISCTWAGVLLPGAYGDGQQPFAVGTLYFKDGGASRSIPMRMYPKSY